MTFTTSVDGGPATVRVALIGRAGALATGLADALTARCPADTVAWALTATDNAYAAAPVEPEQRVDIAVCDGPDAVGVLRRLHPGASVVAVVSARDNGTASVASLQAGADVCVRGSDAGLVAAYLQSVARRRGLVAAGSTR